MGLRDSESYLFSFTQIHMRTQDGVCQEKCVSNLKITKNRLFGCKCQINNLLIQYNKEVLDKEVHPY